MALHMDDILNQYEFNKLFPEGREWINVRYSSIIAQIVKSSLNHLKRKKAYYIQILIFKTLLKQNECLLSLGIILDRMFLITI